MKDEIEVICCKKEFCDEISCPHYEKHESSDLCKLKCDTAKEFCDCIEIKDLGDSN